MKTENHINTPGTLAAKNQQSPMTLLHFTREESGGAVFSRSLLKALEDELSEMVEVTEVNANEFPELLVEFMIYRIPSILLVRHGKVLGKWEGVIAENKFRKELRQLLVSHQETSEINTQQ